MVYLIKELLPHYQDHGVTEEVRQRLDQLIGRLEDLYHQPITNDRLPPKDPLHWTAEDMAAFNAWKDYGSIVVDAYMKGQISQEEYGHLLRFEVWRSIQAMSGNLEKLFSINKEKRQADSLQHQSVVLNWWRNFSGKFLGRSRD